MLAFAYLQTDCNSTEHVALYPLMDSAEITRTSSRYGGMSRRIFAPWKFNAHRMILVLRAGQRENCRHASWNNTMSPTGQLPYCHALINPRVSFVFFAYGRELVIHRLIEGKSRQGKARQGKARQGKARQGKARQGKARHLYM